MVSSEGGVDIENVAKNTPEKIIKVWINPNENLSYENAQKLAEGLNFTDDIENQAIEVFINMYKCYIENQL